MNYTKPPVSFTAQVAKLKARGLSFKDENLAASYLNNISYYRLRAYTYFTRCKCSKRYVRSINFSNHTL